MAAMAALAQHHKTHQTAVGGEQLQQAATAPAVPAVAPAAASATAEGAPQVRAFLPGAASLIEQLDTRALVILRDGRHLVGTLRSLDQFSNLVLEDSFERHIVENKYADIYLGLYIVRGESVVMVAEIADEDEDGAGENMQKVEMDELLDAKANLKNATPLWDF